MRIALDAMGGDHGPEELIDGALLAVKQTDLQVTLVGNRQVLQAHLDRLRSGDTGLLQRIQIVHAAEVVEMSESPVDAIRKKKDASVLVAFDLVRQGQADAAVSAGNSGATMAAAVRKLGRMEHVSRPGIASIFPTLKKPVVMMDVGANVDCRPQHLFQFAVMASAFSHIFDIDRPRIGILSIGEEIGKGNTLVKETYARLAASSLNFMGNVEGRDVFQGNVDVIVCDGFVGNICLKLSEGLAGAAMQMLKDEIMKSTAAKIGYFLARPAFRSFAKRVDYAEYGGAPLLGINGVGIICHGKSSAEAIKNAILEAAKMVEKQVNQRIAAGLAEIAQDEEAVV
ncbi:MAG: phosphate acyltransferase PlsX [Desulfocapsaceae bacterium]|nr:phosphate acyltransferase PlsX [Desulfocapsaceae bacterium]